MTFKSLVEVRNFSECAKQLGKTQGTVSQQLKELEESLGIELIERNSKSFKLTSQGQIVYNSIGNILQELNAMNTRLAAFSGKEIKKISISASSIPGEYILPKIINSFREKYPDIDFQLKVTNTKQAWQDMAENKTIFIGIGAKMTDDESLFQFLTIGSDNIIILARKNHPIFEEIAQTKLDNVESLLCKYPWIFRESGSANREEFISHISFANNIKIGLELHNNMAILNALENSNALTAISSIAFESLGKDKSLEIIKHTSIPIIHRELYLAMRKETQLNPIEELFWNFIKKIGKSGPNHDN